MCDRRDAHSLLTLVADALNVATNPIPILSPGQANRPTPQTSRRPARTRLTPAVPTLQAGSVTFPAHRVRVLPVSSLAMSAMPLLLGVLCVMAIAYRYYSAFLAAKVATLDDLRETPALRFNDGQNFHPTSKWVLFGHHFAAISGAGPLIGPVLAAQFGYMPGLLWIVIGVCLAGAVQDFLVLVASTRRGGRSLAQIAFQDAGKAAGIASTIAILFIIVVALAGLGKVVVKALGGETVAYPPGATLVVPSAPAPLADNRYRIPANTEMRWNDGRSRMTFSEDFTIQLAAPAPDWSAATTTLTLPPGTVRVVPGSSWGTFTIAATIPIALFVGLYMYRIRPGRVLEASLIGAVLTLAATFAGGFVAHSSFATYFDLSAKQVTLAMAAYGFIAAVLPVWVLLCPRDYLSSFLKIGTIVALVIGVLIANPTLHAPAFNSVFASGGPVVAGQIFPFLFITVMCGAISGFHALVSSGTTPKMIKRETHARPIGYGAMLIEGLVGVVAMIAAASLPVNDYYAMNTELSKLPQWHDRILMVSSAGHGVEHAPDAAAAATAAGTVGAATDNVGRYEDLTNEALRGRTGGAVTLAVGMAHIFDQAAARVTTLSRPTLEALWGYWYHFAIMFEALFILTTIDTGTRIGRFLLQEVLGRAHPRLGLQGGPVAGIVATAAIVVGWAWFMNSGNFPVIWGIFGIANQVLAVIALAIVSAHLTVEGKARYLYVTVLPMLAVATTTSTAAVHMLISKLNTISTQLANAPAVRDGALLFNSVVQTLLLVAMFACMAVVLVSVARRIWTITSGPATATPASVG